MLLTSSLAVDFLLLVVILVYSFYKYLTRNFGYWKKRGVFHIQPTPFFGNFSETFRFRTTLAQELKCLYDKTDKPYFGVYMIDAPVLVIRSPELIQHILIKDFSFFRNRSWASPKHNPIIANFLIFQEYIDWKRTRLQVVSLFSKLKLNGMFHTAQPIIQNLDQYLTKHAGIIEAKELSNRYSTEVITRCFFGLTGNCFEDDNSIIWKISRRAFNFTLRNTVVQLLYILKASWVDVLKLNFMRLSDQDFLINAVMDVVTERKATQKNIGKGIDYIDMILEKIKDSDCSKTGLTELISNTIQFFLAGTETMSGLQSFTLYELAIHSKVQDKVRNEILEIKNKHGAITFEAINEMKYLECCLYETMRRYVSLQILDRIAVEDYIVPGTNFVIEKGTTCFVPFYAIHNDKEYYPRPDEYIPERFQEGNLNQKLHFMPFGAGPRQCIGERFGLLMSKYIVAAIITSYKLNPSDKTPKSVKMEPKAFTFQSTVGLPLKFISLNN